MSDLSDPTALPDALTIRNAVAQKIADKRSGGDGNLVPNEYDYELADAVTSILAPHFATELDELRAQIEEIRKATSDHKLADGDPSEFAGFGEGLDRGASIRSQSIRRILAQSPRGTVAQEPKTKCRRCGGTRKVNLGTRSDAEYWPCPECAGGTEGVRR